METMAFLGCSRGLGREVCLEAHKRGLIGSAFLSARNEERLSQLGQSINGESTIYPCDYSKPDSFDNLVEALKNQNIERLFYFAAGGPYGKFASKEWKDHQWSLQVSFLTPMRLLHTLLSDSGFSSLKQIVFIGSQVADALPDPGASSYGASKHGLKGLVKTVIVEGCDKDVRLFRPGYLDTDMLPAHSEPRKTPEQIMSPATAVHHFWDWATDQSGPKIYSI